MRTVVQCIMIFWLLMALVVTYAFKAHAHDQWADASSVPAWVKTSCCGPADAHHLQSSDVVLDSDGYHVKGFPVVIAYKDALPSMDGDYWIFYGRAYSGPGYDGLGGGSGLPHVYCFFAPTGA